jgi:CDP-paratose 2-epimerase
MIEKTTGKPMKWRYVDENSIGVHMCYYSDLRRIRADYPAWDITKKLDDLFNEIAESWLARLETSASL